MARRRRHYLDKLDSVDFYSPDNEETREDVMYRMAEERSRLDSIGNVYQTADRIISGEDIEVNIVSNNEMVELSDNDGRVVAYNANLIENLDTNTIVSFNGTNYHELAHILFSPRKGSALGQHVHNNRMKRAFNMLEEARIERLLSAKYPASRPYLEASVLEYALKGDPNMWGNLFPIITGRRYLDIELRQMIADKFISKYGAEMANKISAIVNEYTTLAFPTDFTRGIELITEYSQIVGLDELPQGSAPVNTGGCTSYAHTERDVLQKGRPATAREQERLQDKAGNTGKGEDLSGNPSNNESNSEGGKAGNGVGGDTVVNTEQREYTDEDKDIANALSDRLEEIMNDSRIKNDVRDLRKAITGNDDIRSTLPNAQRYEQEVSAKAINYARKFGIELERMVRDADPKWETEVPYGKLNISRTMTPDVNRIDRVFDRWDIGNDNTDIEAVILLDNSGSMGGYMNEVCEKAWIIKRGIESIDGNVTVYNFHSYSELLYDKEEKAKPRIYHSVWAQGSTNPVNALIEAERILSTSNKHIKMLYVVTDGQWDSNEDCDVVIKRLNKMGILTTVVFMGNYEYVSELIKESNLDNELAKEYLNRIKHGASLFKAVADPKDVLELAVDIVKSKVGK